MLTNHEETTIWTSLDLDDIKLKVIRLIADSEIYSKPFYKKQEKAMKEIYELLDKNINKEKRIVVCVKCGSLYDLHYVDDIKITKNKITNFKCQNCGMVEVIIK